MDGVSLLGCLEHGARLGDLGALGHAIELDQRLALLEVLAGAVADFVDAGRGLARQRGEGARHELGADHLRDGGGVRLARLLGGCRDRQRQQGEEGAHGPLCIAHCSPR